QVENSTGCKSFVFSKQITVTANPVADFTFGNACLPAGTMQFTNTSTIADGTQGSFGYQWTFSDGGTSAIKDPSHNYSVVGPFTVKLVVTSNAGCVDSTTKTVNTI